MCCWIGEWGAANARSANGERGLVVGLLRVGFRLFSSLFSLACFVSLSFGRRARSFGRRARTLDRVGEVERPLDLANAVFAIASGADPIPSGAQRLLTVADTCWRSISPAGLTSCRSATRSARGCGSASASGTSVSSTCRWPKGTLRRRKLVFTFRGAPDPDPPIARENSSKVFPP